MSLSCQKDGTTTAFTLSILNSTYSQIEAEVPPKGLAPEVPKEAPPKMTKRTKVIGAG